MSKVKIVAEDPPLDSDVDKNGHVLAWHPVREAWEVTPVMLLIDLDLWRPMPPPPSKPMLARQRALRRESSGDA